MRWERKSASMASRLCHVLLEATWGCEGWSQLSVDGCGEEVPAKWVCGVGEKLPQCSILPLISLS